MVVWQAGKGDVQAGAVVIQPKISLNLVKQ
jgi:hypothetical protein